MNLQNALKKILADWVQASSEIFSQHPLAQFIRHDFPQVVTEIVHEDHPDWGISGSAGQGTWAKVPWLSIRNPQLSTSTQNGLYPVYLFCADGSGVYLSLIQGTTDPEKELGKEGARDFMEAVKEAILNSLDTSGWEQQPIDLKADTSLSKSYERANVLSRFYPADELPSNEQLVDDLKAMLTLYQEIKPEMLNIEGFRRKHFLSEDGSIQLHTTPDEYAHQLSLPRSFLLLAGISGTGKTRFIREQAQKSSLFPDNYCLVPVRPDWVEPSDLLGYVSRLTAHNQPEYVVTQVLSFIVAAWRHIIDSGLALRIDPYTAGRQLSVQGRRAELAYVAPFWLCLDEMNLAPVEQYFADYLSLSETQQWQWSGEEFSYRSDALLKSSAVFNDDLRAQLGLLGAQYDELWKSFCAVGIPIPFNLIVTGTVNMDESTHGFSRKVLDRALSIDFGTFFPNDFERFFDDELTVVSLTYPRISHIEQPQLKNCIDHDGSRSIAFLSALNKQLTQTPFELAYRALNELLITVANYQPTNEVQLQAVWDDFVMTKVLPRIEGDVDRLGVGLAGIDNDGVLLNLESVLQEQLAEIWPQSNRPDWYRERQTGEPLTIPCRSKVKIQWMQKRLQASGFTSFWP